MSDLLIFASICVHYENFAVTFVFRYAVIRYRIRNFLSVGRYGESADTSHSPKCFGSHALPFDLNIRFLDKHLICLACVFGSSAGS